MAVSVESGFIESMRRLGAQDGMRALTFLQRFHQDPASPGLSLERVSKARSDAVWSGRVSRDLRVIIYRDGPDDYLLYVDHHDRAYEWARRRRFERHPRLNTLQFFVAAEDADTPGPPGPARTDDEAPIPRSGLLDHHSDDYLLSLGVPGDWLPVLREVVDQDQLLEVVMNLPGDVADRLLELSTGKLVTPPAPRTETIAIAPVTESSDRTVSPELADLERLLAEPLAVWIAFLHPSQRRLATADHRGPAKVTGSAGTGKTVVAIHRARHLARQGRRVLLTSYVTTLCHNLEHSLGLLCTDEELARIEVRTVLSVARDLTERAGRLPARILNDDEVRELIERFMRRVPCPLGRSAMLAEWNLIVQAQDIQDWEGYRTASRAGRGTPLTAADRRVVWGVLERVQNHLAAGGAADWQGVCRIAREAVEQGTVVPRWDSVIVDEVQDLSAQALRLVAAIGGSGPNGLMVVGDGGQRIFAHRTSLRSIGIDVRGRSRMLRVNYRTTSEIRRFADHLLNAADDLDGTRERRDACRSIRSGTTPAARGVSTAAEQYESVRDEVRARLAAGLAPSEIAVIARTRTLLDKAGDTLDRGGIATHVLVPEKGDEVEGAVQLLTMHRAKGLEFKVVIVVDASTRDLPNRYAVNRAGDDQDRAEAIERERQLLYVSLTRARDELLVMWVGEPSEFLEEALTAPSVAAGA